MRSPREATMKRGAVRRLVLRLLQAIYIILEMRPPREMERAYEEMRSVLEELGVKVR